LINLENITPLISSIFRSSVSVYKKIFCKRTLILISQNKIRNIEISPITQIGILALVVIVSNLLYNAIMFDDIIKSKSEKIANLESVNTKFRKELVEINVNLEKIDNYFIASEGYEKNLGNKGLHDKSFQKLFSDLKLDRSYKRTAVEIASAHVMLDNINDLAKKRIANLEHKITQTGIVLNEAKMEKDNNNDDLVALSLNTEDELSKQGGPLDLAGDDQDDSNQSIDIGSIKIDDEISYLSNLEQFIYHAPLAKPMKDYYVSSTFGGRVDPIKHIHARHDGMDFVGKDHAKVLSPSISSTPPLLILPST